MTPKICRLCVCVIISALLNLLCVWIEFYTSNVKLLSLRMCLWRSLCTLYLLACQMKVTVGDSGLCCCVYVTLSSANQFPCVLIGISWNFVFFTLLPLMLLHLLHLMLNTLPTLHSLSSSFLFLFCSAYGLKLEEVRGACAESASRRVD